MKKPTKTQKTFLNVAPFLGLAFFKIWAGRGIDSPAHLLAASTVLLVYCIFVILIAFRYDRPSYLDWAVTSYFMVITSCLALAPETAAKVLSHYSITGIYTCLFAAAFLPPLLGMAPFTLQYAKRYAPEQVWRNPVFLRINQIMTYAWQAIFALCLVISLYPSLVTRAFIPLCLLLGVGLPFNLRFPDYYLKRSGLPSLAEQRRMASNEKLMQNELPFQGPLPATAREAILKMAQAFNPGAAQTLSAVIGFAVTGTENFEAALRIQDGTCILEEHLLGKPDLLIRTPAQVWLAVARGERSGLKAFEEGAYTAEGNLGILMQMGQLFNPRKGA
ncbi:MAG: SCP2 sterol-binding domain-containing protein [Desulfatitalea sp.]